MTDFNDMTYEELKAARDDIDSLMEQRRLAALEDFKATAQAMGMDLSALCGTMNGHKKPTYRNPDNPDETYSRGKYPAWLRDKIDAGASLEDFRI